MDPGLPAHHAATADRAHKGARLLVGGMALNAILAAIKIAGGLLGSAYALVADGVESLGDVAVSLLVLAGVRWAGLPPDQDHPYGHGKAESVSGLFAAVVVVLAGFGVGWHAVSQIRHPSRAPAWWTLVILAGVVGAKLAFSRRLSEVGRDTASTALGAEAWHHFSDAITSAAAFVGISLAVTCGQGWESADGWAALVASGVIAFNGVRIFVRSFNEIMDIAVPETIENGVREIASGVSGVASLHKCRVRKSGLSYLVDIQIRVDAELTVRRGHEISHAVKDELLASGLRISDVTVHVEPDS